MATTEREEILLLKKDQEYMKEKIDNIESLLKEFISSAPEKFATKAEHKNNHERINKIESAISKVAWAIIMWVLGLAGAGLFVIIMLFWDKF